MVVNENEEVLAKESINATSNATYSYSFMSEQDRSNFPMCSRLVFSVSAINSIGRSQSVNVTLWDNSEGKPTQRLKTKCMINCLLISFRSADDIGKELFHYQL